MSAPSIVGVSPNPNSTDIVLGTTIVVTFDQLMTTSTINSSTFSLTGPGQTQFISPTVLNSRRPISQTGREYVTGTFAFTTNVSGNTVLTFTPSVPLRPNVTYTVLVVGAGNNSATGSVVSNTDVPPTALDSTYEWTFTTGDLNTSIPPIISPLPPLTVPLNPEDIKIQEQVWTVGNDLSQIITITFPSNIDTNTVSASQILLSLEAMLGDPSVQVPPGLTPTVVISANTITITITGWPSS